MRVILLLSAVVAVALAYPDEMYTTKFDNIALDDILNNERLLKKAFLCLMDEGGCTPDIAELKSKSTTKLPSSTLKYSRTIIDFLSVRLRASLEIS